MVTLELSERELHDLKSILIAASTKIPPNPVGEQEKILKSILSIAGKADNICSELEAAGIFILDDFR